jgi:hypothetical protein
MIRRFVTAIVSWLASAGHLGRAPNLSFDGRPLDIWSLSAKFSAQYRQGNLLFVHRPSLPRQCVARPDSVIERSAASGHAHLLVGGVVCDGPGRSAGVYVEAGIDARIMHEEHDALALPEGAYVVIRQREYRGEED